MSRKDLSRWNMLAVAAAAAPLAVVELTHVVLDEAGPRLTSAAPNPDADATPSIAPAKPTSSQQRAAARAAQLASTLPESSPFRPAPPAPPTEPPRVTPPEPEAPAPHAPEPTMMPEVSVRMIVRQPGGGAKALINGKVRGAGDRIADGWTIASVDADARSVTFRADDGSEYVVTLKGHESER